MGMGIMPRREVWMNVDLDGARRKEKDEECDESLIDGLDLRVNGRACRFE